MDLPIFYYDFDDEIIEPDLNELQRLLGQTEQWLLAEDDEFPILTLTAVGLCMDMLSPQNFETQDDFILSFIKRMDYALCTLRQEPEREILRNCIEQLRTITGNAIAAMEVH